MIKRLSCVLKLNDSSTGRNLQSSEAALYVDGVRTPHQYKAGGYFVLIDLLEGIHKIRIFSPIYQTAEIDAVVDYSIPFNEKENVIYAMLNPSPQNPQTAVRPCVKGLLKNAGGRVFLLLDHKELKIAEDNANVGSTLIKMFCTSVPTIPSMFLINDKSSQKKEFVVIKGVSGDGFMLAGPLKYAHSRSTAVIELIEYSVDENGRFFAMLPNGFPKNGEGKISAVFMLSDNGSLISKKFSLNGKGVTEGSPD